MQQFPSLTLRNIAIGIARPPDYCPHLSNALFVPLPDKVRNFCQRGDRIDDRIVIQLHFSFSFGPPARLCLRESQRCCKDAPASIARARGDGKDGSI